MTQSEKALSCSLFTWGCTTLTIFFGTLYFMRRVMAPRKHPEPLISAPVTVVVDEKEGIRRLNPKYMVNCEESMACNSIIYDSICVALQDHLAKHPDVPVFGSHATPTDPYQWITYRQFFDIFTEFGSGLKHLLAVEPGSGSMLGIYSVNCVEWMASHYGMLFYSNVAVPLYSTLGEEAMIHIVKLTKMTICMCMNEERAESLLNVILAASKRGDSEVLSTLKHIVLMKPKSEETTAQLKKTFATEVPSLQFHTFNEVRQAGRQGLLPYVLPKDTDTFVLNFTSGTTGVPKGVIISCGMFQHVIKSVLLSRNILNLENCTKKWWMDQNDVYFSFLPLAHVLEQTLMAAAIFVRARVGFYSGDMNRIMEDIGTLRPTMMALVPRLLLRIYDATLTKLREKHIPKFILTWAINSKLDKIAKIGKPVRNTVWDRVLFGALQQKLGGRLRTILTGGAACPHDVLDFARAAFGAIIHQGYGSTETGGAVALTFADDVSPVHVGAILDGTEVKLADVPDMELFPSKEASTKRGEICVRGPNCTPGYFKNDEKTAELIDAQGWLHTGDVGEWDPMGRLMVVDRCKSIFKLSQGEYVAPERVENVYMTSPLVKQAFLDGRSDSIFAVAIVHPDGSRVAQKLGLRLRNEGDSVGMAITLKELCFMPEAEQLLLDELNALGKKNGLAGFELAKKILLIPEPFSIEKGLMTATLKPIRSKIREHFAQDIRRMYASGL